MQTTLWVVAALAGILSAEIRVSGFGALMLSLRKMRKKHLHSRSQVLPTCSKHRTRDCEDLLNKGHANPILLSYMTFTSKSQGQHAH